MSAAHFLKVSAELSAAHNFHSERERHFLVSKSYSGQKLAAWVGNFGRDALTHMVPDTGDQFAIIY